MLGKEKAQELDADLTLTEVQEAVAKLRHGKTPGPNGLPAELYKRCIDLLGRIC